MFLGINNYHEKKVSDEEAKILEDILKRERILEKDLKRRLNVLIIKYKNRKSYYQALCSYKEYFDKKIKEIEERKIEDMGSPNLSIAKIYGRQILVHKDGHMLHDAVTFTDKYKEIQIELEKEIFIEVGAGGYMGFCHLYWSAKKRILKDKFDIEWYKPTELNHGVFFD